MLFITCIFEIPLVLIWKVMNLRQQVGSHRDRILVSFHLHKKVKVRRCQGAGTAWGKGVSCANDNSRGEVDSFFFSVDTVRVCLLSI